MKRHTIRYDTRV